MNSISPPKENKTLSCYRYDDSKISEDIKNFKKIKKTNSIKTIFLYSKNNEINKKIDNDIKSNLNINNININGSKAVKSIQKDKNLCSPKFGDKKTIDSYYDSIETETIIKKNNKTINPSETTAANFRKKSYIKSNNNLKKILYTNKNKDNNNISKIKTRTNSKKLVKKNSSNNTNNKNVKNKNQKSKKINIIN